jgi:hypothetical protein
LDTQLDELSRVAKTLATGGPVALKRAVELTRSLNTELMKHILVEGKILLPALRDSDAWGKVRADKLLDRLRIRRRELKDLGKSCTKAESETLGGDIDRFIDDRRADMALAERDVMGPTVLRDDVLGIDSDGG